MTSKRSRVAPIAVVILSLLIYGIGGVVAGPRARAAASLPPVLPNLQQWSGSFGSGYAWSGAGRIIVSTSDASALTADARTFASDLALDLNTQAPAVVTGTLANAAPGDIFVSLGSTDTQLGSEGYALTVAPVLQVNARSAAGAFWASRTILQLLRQSRSLPPGSARDWPQYPVRSVLVDNAGRTFPLGFWHNEIRELSYFKVNELMVYISGLGLTDGQLQQLSAFANAYHVNLVGQVNVPGHMDTADEGLPAQPSSYNLKDKNGAAIPGALDITNPTAVAWAQNLFSSYVDQFSTPIWHTGGDEYAYADKKMNDPVDLPALADYAVAQYGPSGTIEDVYRAFMNQMDGLAHQHGKSLRMWNDNLFPSNAVKLDSDITVEYWLHSLANPTSPGSQNALTPTDIANNGNQLINASLEYLYYNETANPSGQGLWEQFDPAVFDGGYTLPGGATDPHLSGIKFSSWDMNKMDVGLLERNLQPLQQAFAQRAWGSPKLYPTWAAMGSVLTAIGRAPGFLDTPAAGDPGAGSLPSSKAIVFDNAEHTFTVQSDGSILHSFYSYTTGAPYATEVVAPPGSAVGQPTAFASPGQQHVFARGPDGHLHHWVTGSVSGGWATDDWTAKAVAYGSPLLDLASDPAGFMYVSQQQVFGRGSDGHLHHWVYSAWNNTITADDWGGQLTGDPSPVVWGVVQNVFGRAADGSLRHWWWEPSDPDYVHQESWAGPLLASDASPLAIDANDAALHVFARDGAGHLQHWSFDQQAGQTSEEDLTAATGLSIAGNPSGFEYVAQQHVYFRDASTGHMDHVWTKPGFSPAAQDLSAITPDGVVGIVGDTWSDNVMTQEQHAFGLDASGHVHHWFWVNRDNSLHQDTWQQ